MKKIIAIGIFLASLKGYSQIVPNTSTSPASVSSGNIHTIPSAYNDFFIINGVNLSYVRTWEASKPYTTDTDVTSTSRTPQEVKQSTHYFDGLGRPLQTVVKQISPSGKDMVSPVVYDSFGREVYKYLPYVQIDSNTTTGKFKLDPFHNQASFYSNTTYNPGLSGEQIYYAKTNFESSPLNRPDTTFAPGNSWGGSHVGVSVQYLINSVADSVRIWNIDMTIGSTPTTTSKYAAGLLYKTVTTDEHGKQTIEYKDKEGHVILKKVQLSSSPSSHHTGWLCTYYVYDDLNNLRFVIPPKAVETISSSSWNITPTIADELCFRYEYDVRNRMMIKKIPGAGELSMVYDARDRLVMTQDYNMFNVDDWLVTQYDALNRPVRTWIFNDGNTREDHQGWAAGETNYPTQASLDTYGELLTETYYDDYSWVSGSGSGLSSSLITTYNSNTSYFYTASNSTFPYPQSITATNVTTGMVTGTKVKVLGTSTYLYNVNFYDDHGRVIQTHSTNYSGAKDTITNQYDFSGKVLRNLVCHSKSGTNSQSYIVLTKMDYDDAGRLTKISKKVGSTAETVIAENTYTELGQLKIKKLGRTKDGSGDYTSDAIDSLNYTYNIRGWLSGINKDYARGSNNNNWFGMELSYDFGFSQTQLNGNIAGERWRSKGDGEQRAYGFSYDAVNRLMKSDFTQYTSSAWNTSAGIDYSMKMGDGSDPTSAFDPNGNILKMWQKGLKLTSSATIDSLTYTYSSNSNKLAKVTDGITADNKLGDFKDGTNNDDDYSYDGNGNLKIDQNKNITSITYNHLNLPDSIRILSKGTIKYTYDGTGNKLQKKTIDSTGSSVVTTTTSYIDGFVYQNDTLQFINHEEGRIRYAKKYFYSGDSAMTFQYDYFLKDHLGNVRSVLTEQVDTSVYMATMESDKDAFEDQLFNNRINLVTKPIFFDSDGNNHTVQEIGTEGVSTPTVVGVGIVLKVMAGDHVNGSVLGFVDPIEPNSNYYTYLYSLETIISNLFASGITSTNLKGNETSVTSSTLLGGIHNFLNQDPGPSNYSDIDGGYLNWILLDDEQFKLVTANNNSGFSENLTEHITGSPFPLLMNGGNGIDIVRNGYLYIFVSHTAGYFPAYFDNFHVEHTKGPLQEETHYYPFGLTMAGISSRAAAELQNKDKTFQGQKFDDDLGINYDEFKYRNHDPQIGRFIEIDPLSDKYVYNSTYAFSENKVTDDVELEGLESLWSFFKTLTNSAGISENTTTESFANGLIEQAKKPETYGAAINVLGQVAGAALIGIATGGFGATTTMAAESGNTTTAISTTSEIKNTETVVSLETRAEEIHSTLPEYTQTKTTTATASATTSDGKNVTLVASSEKNLRPAQRAALKPGEVAVSGNGHAEQTIINHANQNGLTVTKMAASRPICENCAAALKKSAIEAASVLKKVGTTTD